MSNKTKLLYVTEEQKLWLDKVVKARIKNPEDTDDILIAAAFIKKLRGRESTKTK